METVGAPPRDEDRPTAPPPSGEAFLHRPSLGIRARLSIGFLSLFLVAMAVTAAAYFMLSRLEVRLRFLEVADRYTMEIQQARRFEKNYFLYGTNLQDVEEHVTNARGLLTSASPEAALVLPPSDIRKMREHLDRYQSLIARLAALDRSPRKEGAEEKAAIEAELRTHGFQMVAFAMELAQKERTLVNDTLALFKRLPLIFLAVLLALSVIIANFLARQMMGPLTRLVAAAQRIAQGDFTPMQPARWYRDEFSNLAIALNTMMSELARRQEVLVQSHKLRAVGTLTAGVAHELNNPINNIMLTAELLKEDYPTLSDEERLDMVNDLVEQADPRRLSGTSWTSRERARSTRRGWILLNFCAARRASPPTRSSCPGPRSSWRFPTLCPPFTGTSSP